MLDRSNCQPNENFELKKKENDQSKVQILKQLTLVKFIISVSFQNDKLKEEIQLKEKENEELVNKIKEYEHSVQVYREQQQVERLKLNKNELNVIFKLYSFDLFN